MRFCFSAGVAAIVATFIATLADAPVPIRISCHPGSVADLLPIVAGDRDGMLLVVIEHPNLRAVGPHVIPCVRKQLQVHGVRVVAAEEPGKLCRFGTNWSQDQRRQNNCQYFLHLLSPKEPACVKRKYKTTNLINIQYQERTATAVLFVLLLLKVKF